MKKLNEKSILTRLSDGEMLAIIGGNGSNDSSCSNESCPIDMGHQDCTPDVNQSCVDPQSVCLCLAGCGCNPQSVCNPCLANF